VNRKERRSMLAEQRAFERDLPDTLTLVPREEYPVADYAPDKVWRSKRFLVQLYNEDVPEYPGLIRLSVCRSKLTKLNHWKDSISWDELQDIKRGIGFGDYYAVEVYPRDRDMVNVANMRHLWVLPLPLRIGWF